MATAASTAAPATTAQRGRASSGILRVLGKAPVHLLLVVVGLLWLIPTLGLFITSLLAPQDFQEQGWWQVFSEPSKLTFRNYEAVFDNEAIVDALITTAIVAVGGTVL